MLGLRDPIAALSGGLDRNLEGRFGNPGRDLRYGRGAVVSHENVSGRIGTFAGRDAPGLGDSPLGAGHVEVGRIIHGREGERAKVPSRRRPVSDSGNRPGVGYEFGGVKPAGFEVVHGSGGGDRFGMIPDASGREKNDESESQEPPGASNLKPQHDNNSTRKI